MKKKKRLLVCYTELLHYRLDVLRALAKDYDLTVVHSGKNMTGSKSGFHEVVLPLRSVWKFRYQVGLLRLVRKEKFDVVVFFFDLAWISIVLSFLFCPRDSRRITWGLWRTKLFLANWVRLLVSRVADSNIFYSAGAANDFLKNGTPEEKIVVARNTFFVEKPGRNEDTTRDCVLFVGTFNHRKQNDVLVLAFSKAVRCMEDKVRLVFVGDGVEKEKIMALAKGQECCDRIEFYPGETDQEVLRSYYDRAICSVSFGQAGLSVLQSFGYGVPFVTRRDAISGGEIENIVEGFNGVLCDSNQSSLESVLTNLCADQVYSGELGRNALSYYENKASVEVMLAGFISAIETNREYRKADSTGC